jgi:hypothetical protein
VIFQYLCGWPYGPVRASTSGGEIIIWKPTFSGNMKTSITAVKWPLCYPGITQATRHLRNRVRVVCCTFCSKHLLYPLPPNIVHNSMEIQKNRFRSAPSSIMVGRIGYQIQLRTSSFSPKSHPRSTCASIDLPNTELA